jgi:hypothetical protein
MRFATHKMLSPLTIVTICLSVIACGGESKRSGSATIPNDTRTQSSIYGDYDGDDHSRFGSEDGDSDDNGKPKDGDNDTDNSSGSYYDSDDDSVRHYGHAADTSDRSAIAALVKRYYAAAATEDGAAACSMILSNLVRSVPRDLGRPPGPPYLRGNTCAIVMSKIFKEHHLQLAAYAGGLEVTGVRVDHDHGLAVLGFKTLPGRQIRVAREARAWKLEALLDSELP